MKKKSDVFDAVTRLINGNYDVPIVATGSAGEKKLLSQLEVLRRKMAAAQSEKVEGEEKMKLASASIVHDLKTPLALISGYAQCMKDGMSDKDYLSLIIERTELMNETVLSILEVSEADYTSVSRREEVSAREFFSDMFLKYASLAEAKNIKYKRGKVPNVKVCIDKQQVERVVHNLVANAVKYSDKSKSKIKVKFRIKDGFLRVSVRDNGRGIKRGSIRQIFDAYFTEDSARTISGISGASSGIGLAASKGIVESHGGKIWARSRQAEWSKFIFTLPVVKELGKNKLKATERFEARSKPAKIVFLLLLGWIFSPIFRVFKLIETKSGAQIFNTVMSFIFFYVFWITDIISEAVFDRIVMAVS